MAEKLEVIILGKDQLSKTIGGIKTNLQSVGKLALGVAGGGIAALGAGFVGLATKAIPAASDVTESMNAVNKVFEENADIVLSWGKNAATQAGLAESAFFQMSAQTGAMLQNLGLDQKAAAQESVNLAQRAADMASIFNTDVSEALGAIQAGLRGEADPLERFGVRLSAAAVQAHAVEMGLIGAKDKMDDQTRALASLSLFYQQTDKLAGDFVDTSGDLANAQRVAGAQWENILATIGQIGLPILGEFFNILSTQVLPVVNTFAQYIGFVVQEGDSLNDFLADLPVWLQPIAKTVGDIVVAFQNFIGFIQSGQDPIASLTRLAYDLGLAFGLSGDEAHQISQAVYGIIQAVQNAIPQIQAFLEPVVTWIRDNVELKDVLVGLAIAIASVVIPAIISVVTAVGPVILIFAAVTAAVAVLRNAWETNWGGIQEKTQAAINFIGPLIESLTQFWEDTLLPAIKNVWKFLTDDMMPVWEALGDLLSATVGTAVEALAALWENVLRPALETVWQFIQDNVIPIFDNLSSAVGGVSGAISTVVGWITDLANAIRNLPSKLPEWLQQHSPSPFEQVFINVNRHIRELVTESIPNLKTSLAEIGHSIVTDLIENMEEGSGVLEKAVNGLLNFAGAFSSLGGAAGNLFKKRVVDPLEDALDAANQNVEKSWDRMIDMLKDAGLGNLAQLVSEGQVDLQQAVEVATSAFERGLISRQSYKEILNTIDSIIAGQSEASKLGVELSEQQEKLLELQRQQENLGFLQQQVNLLQTIAEHGLDASEILGGLQLGIDADLGQVIQAMTRAMQALIGQAEEELGIASPSKIFERMGQQLMSGLARGIVESASLPTNAVVNNFNMTINEAGRIVDPASSFMMFRALAGAG